MSFRVPGIGVALAAAGLSHFARPEWYEPMTKLAFPRNTRRHVYIDGGIETAIGVGLVLPQTRKYAIAGAVGYVGYLGYSAVRTLRS